MRGHPRLCMGLHNLGWASTFSTHMLASTNIRGSWKTWTLSLPSTHMLAVLLICVALDWASKDGVTFSSSNAWRSVGHVWAWLDVILDRDLCELSTHMRGLPRLCVGLVKLLATK
ncbi:hypothetical protein PIB30_108784, partial [Stylosanthes scabra]|nr:hypothetical protein [Stylosanthes scabra]